MIAGLPSPHKKKVMKNAMLKFIYSLYFNFIKKMKLFQVETYKVSASLAGNQTQTF